MLYNTQIHRYNRKNTNQNPACKKEDIIKTQVKPSKDSALATVTN